MLEQGWGTSGGKDTKPPHHYQKKLSKRKNNSSTFNKFIQTLASKTQS